MTSSPLIETELDLRLVTVSVDGVEIMNRAGRDVGGVTAMAPEDSGIDTRIADVAGTFVGWRREVRDIDTAASGVISVQIGSASAAHLSSVVAAGNEVKIVFLSNGSGLGFKSQTLEHAKIRASPVSIEPVGVRMYPFLGWDYTEVPN